MTRALIVRLPDCQFNGPGIVPFARDIENFWYKAARLALTDPSPQLYVRRLRWAGEMLEGLINHGVDVSAFSRKHLLRECNGLHVDEFDGLACLRAFFDALFVRLDIPYRAFDGLVSAYNDFFEASQARIQRLLNDGVDGIGDLAFFKRAFQPRSGITVSTIHGVKGSEFDVVIGYALLEGMVSMVTTSMTLMAMSARKSCCMWLAPGRASICTCFPRVIGREAEGMSIIQRIVLLYTGSTTTRYEV